nr:filament-like plant protein 4 [Ipomoea trifida]
MDRRSWPWKKKSSDKSAAEKIAAATVDSATDSNAAQGDESKQENYKKPKYVQISVESYSHLTGLEDQVKSYEEQVKVLEEEVKDLNEKLSAAEDEMTNKDNLVKQHAKVAEEAVSGWEKAESEAAALKNHLESVTLLKLTAEDRASHLDGALKECMRQIRNLKEEHEQKLHDVVLNKTKQFDKMKLEFEAKISNLDQELLRSAAENSALSRSLQERSNMLVKLSEEKSQAEAEIEHLKGNIESCEKEINSLKYELHIVAKELEIRNEEKNMCARSAEVANKQQLEGVKKIAKLEAEVQRLRGLVRKKLPGPAALAQMKLEVESLGRDYEETRLRKSPGKPPSSPHHSMPDFSFDNMHKYQKENELLTERLLAMEEETKMLKEALAKRNSELQISRSTCAKTASKLQSLEAMLQVNGDYTSPLKHNMHIPVEGSFRQNASNLRSLASMSEDGNDDTISCAGSWTAASMPDLSHIKKDNIFESPHKSESASHLELMDDFLEMEKLANLSNDSNGGVSSSDGLNNIKSEVENTNTTAPENQASSNKDVSEPNHQPVSEPSPFMKLQSKILMVFESKSSEADMQKVLEDIRRTLQEMSETLNPHSATSDVEALPSSDASIKCESYLEVHDVTAENNISVSHDRNTGADAVNNISQELADAICQIHDFVMFIGKEAKAVQGTSIDGNGLYEKLDEFSATYMEVVSSKVSLVKFVLDLSLVLSKASELHFNILGYKNSETEISSADCIDKVALPENKGQQHMVDGYSNGCARLSDSASDPDIPHDGSLVPTSESTTASWKCSSEEFENLKLEKENLVVDLGRRTENLESTKSQLAETEQLLAEIKSQLISAQKSNSLAETQLKCMAESYNSLEARAENLQAEVNVLQAKIETLDIELQEEKKGHHDALARCKDLQEQLEMIESSKAEIDAKKTQEKELAAAAEKLAECQETIFLLGKQLKSLRPQAEFMGSPQSPRSQKGGEGLNEEPTISGLSLHDADLTKIETAASPNRKLNLESQMELYEARFSPSDSESNNPLRSPVSSKHRPTRSSIPYPASAQTPEKHSRGFSRFFSSKGKSGS